MDKAVQIEVITMARDFLKSGFVTGIRAVDDRGDYCPATHSTAVKFCALGALERAADLVGLPHDDPDLYPFTDAIVAATDIQPYFLSDSSDIEVQRLCGVAQYSNDNGQDAIVAAFDNTLLKLAA